MTRSRAEPGPTEAVRAGVFGLPDLAGPALDAAARWLVASRAVVGRAGALRAAVPLTVTSLRALVDDWWAARVGPGALGIGSGTPGADWALVLVRGALDRVDWRALAEEALRYAAEAETVPEEE